MNMMSLKNRAKNINEGNEKIRVTKIAEDGMETLKILNNDKNIDIALLDFDMPGYDTNQICKKVINKEKYIMLRNSIKEDLKENFISEEEYWQYNKEYSDKIKKIKEDIQLYEEEKETETIKNNDTDWMNIFKKKEKINELNRLLINELIEDIVIEKDNNLKIIFKCEDKYFEALDFINKQNYDIISSS